MMSQASFKKEVTETFLRCVKMGYEQDLAVIELNGLKIAEDRTFADCARHVFASILDLCLPSTATCKAEYQSLFPPDAPNTDTQVGPMHPPPPPSPFPHTAGVKTCRSSLSPFSAVNCTSAGNCAMSA